VTSSLFPTMHGMVKLIRLLHLSNSDWIFQLMNSMEQSPWETNSCSASEEIPYLSWNPEVLYYINNSLPQVTVSRQMKPVHTFPPPSFKIHSNIILPSDLFPSDSHFVW